MSEYLDALIKSLEAEADDQRAELAVSQAKGLKEPKRAASQLKRTLQRLEALNGMQLANSTVPAVARKTRKRAANAA